MIAALLVLLVAVLLVVGLPAPWCLFALIPWAVGLYFFIQSSRGRWG
jgi:hypothetical protein